MTEPTDVTVDVVVPTYRRPANLERCLSAIAAQTRPAAQVVVVAREDDVASHEVVRAAAEHLPCLRLVTVNEPGVIAAMSAGVAAATAPIVAFTDDDAAPHPDWLDRILRHFENPTVGAVGGRDVVWHDGTTDQPDRPVVGRMQWFGRVVGNHHLGVGPARDVDVLKGVNCAFRTEALALPRGGVLRGRGAQVDWELMCCTHVRRRGWRIVYDPAVLVDHYPAPRHDADQRGRPGREAVFDAAYNSVVACVPLGKLWLRRAVFGVLVGTADRPGLGRAVLAVARAEKEVGRRVAPSLAGQLTASIRIATSSRCRGELVVTARDLAEEGQRVVEEKSSVPALAGALDRGLGKVAGDRRPRIALVAHDIHDHGGMERACAELIRNGHDRVAFTVVASDLSPDLRPLVDRWVRIPVLRRPFPLKFTTFFVRAGLAVRRLDVDLVHTVGAIVPNRVDVAAVHFCHAGHRAATGHLAPVGARASRRLNTGIARTLALRAERWCYRPTRLRSFAAVSGGVAEELRSHYPGVPVAVTPNGIDLDRFRPDPAERDRTRAQHGVSPNQVVALFVGGDWNRKGLDLAIDAIAKARADGTQVLLWVVGPGDEARFRARADALGIGDAVVFFGRRSDTERFYRAADVFVLPSEYETFSIVCFEAAACGLPVVAPPLHGVSDLIGDGAAGIVVERSADSVAAAFVALADPATRTRLGEEARRRAQHYTWDRSARSVLDLYRSLLPQEAT